MELLATLVMIVMVCAINTVATKHHAFKVKTLFHGETSVYKFRSNLERDFFIQEMEAKQSMYLKQKHLDYEIEADNHRSIILPEDGRETFMMFW